MITNIPKKYINIALKYHDIGLWQLFLIFTRFLILPFKAIHETLGSALDILELGCGKGVLAHMLLYLSKEERRIYGLDISEGCIAVAKSSAENNLMMEFHVGDMTKLQYYPKKKFDAVLISEVFYTLRDEEIKKVLDNVSQVIKPKGKLIIKDFTNRPFVKFIIFWLETNLLFYLIRINQLFFRKSGCFRQKSIIRSVEKYQRLFEEHGWSIANYSLPQKGFWPHILINGLMRK